MNNTLVIAGIGIKFMSHLTQEVQTCIQSANKVLYLVNDSVMKDWIEKNNPSSESLDGLYFKFSSRVDNYLSISKYVLNHLENTKLLCFITYGHPTILVKPSTYLIKSATENGHKVIVMPGVSSEDCLFADLCIDPSSSGWQSFEATDFLLYERHYDSSCHLILWQISVIGIKTVTTQFNPEEGLKLLTKALSTRYDLDHEVIIYEAAQYPMFQPNIQKVQLKNLHKSKVGRVATLYIPPNTIKKPNQEYLKALNIINEKLS